MGKRIDLIGQRFGRLLVLDKSSKSYSKCRLSMWECICDCGNKKTIIGTNLTRGLTKSCGCLQKEIASKNCSERKVWGSDNERESSPMPSRSVFFGRIPKTDKAQIINGTVHVSCKMCGKIFQPSCRYIISRVQSFEGTSPGENNFYCSDECKIGCPLYRARADRPDPRLRKPKSVTATTRACQTKALKQLQCDEKHGQSYCERCGDLVDVELHHTLPVAEYGEDAINPAGHMLLCVGCHMALHRECA